MMHAIMLGAFFASLAQALRIASPTPFEETVLDQSFPLMHHFAQNVLKQETDYVYVNTVAPPRCNPMAVCATRWPGRLGNNLYHLERLLMDARQNNYCYVLVPKGGAIRDLINFTHDNVIDAFPRAPTHQSIGETQCAKTVEGWGGASNKTSVVDLRSTLAELIVDRSLLRCPSGIPTMITNGTVVLHMRSGDVQGGEYYPQPPCSYYKLVMLKGRGGGSFQKGVILTEPDKHNPCIQALLDAFPGQIAVYNRSVTEDACTMIRAKHLAIAFGTWGPSLSRLNTNLMDLYVPWGEDGVTAEEYGGQLAGKSKHWYHESIYEGSVGYRQHVYSFPGFTSAQSNFSLPDMVTYDMHRIHERIIPA